MMRMVVTAMDERVKRIEMSDMVKMFMNTRKNINKDKNMGETAMETEIRSALDSLQDYADGLEYYISNLDCDDEVIDDGLYISRDIYNAVEHIKEVLGKRVAEDEEG